MTTARRAARRQALAAMVLAAFSLFSPAPDLRPKPILPVKFQQAKPSDPPKFGFDLQLEGADTHTAHSNIVASRQAIAQAGRPPFHPFRSHAAKAEYLARYDQIALSWPVPCEGVHVVTGFGSTYVRVSGPANGPPMVLLHGISSNSLAWMPNIAALAGSHRVYALDHIADGGRSVYTRQLTSLSDQMAWLGGVLDGLGLTDAFNLVGLSYGGWLAAEYALKNPTRVKRMVLLAPAGTIRPLALHWVVRALASAIPLPYFTRSFLRWLLGDLAQRPTSQYPTFDDVVADARISMRTLAPHALVPPTVLTDDELRQLRMPALFVVGQNEKICDPAQALERLHTVAPHIATRLIADAGHDLTVVQSATVNRAVLKFLEGVHDCDSS